MSPAAREVAPSRIEPSGATVEYGVPSHGSHVEEMGTRLLEEPVENLDDEDFRGLDTHPNTGLREEPDSLFDLLRARLKRVMESHLHSMPSLPLYMEMSAHKSLTFQLERKLTAIGQR